MPSDRFVKASSNNLPSLDMFMVMEFIKNDDRFNAAEFRNVKATAATREAYGDNAIGYVELRREGPLCTLQCKVCPEHRVRVKNYSVQLIVDETEEKVLDVICNDCAASSGGCKHALAFLMWVHRRSEESSPTEITSYWVKPRLSTVGTSQKFITAADFSTMNIECPPSSAGSSNFRDEMVEIGLKEQVTGQFLKYASDEEQDKFTKMSIYKLLFRFHALGGVEFEDFLSFSKEQMNLQLCKEAEIRTRGQSVSPLWHEFRFGRVTASKIHEFAHCKVAEGTLVETIIGAYKVKDTKFMQRGRHLEKEVLKTLENQLKIKFKDCGLFMLPSHPVFAASPDAISSEFVVEVKCPASDKSFINYIKNNQITAKFKAQIQLQMLCAGRKRGIFCVVNPDYEQSKSIQILYEDFDEMFIKQLLEETLKNWEIFIFPKLFESVS